MIFYGEVGLFSLLRAFKVSYFVFYYLLVVLFGGLVVRAGVRLGERRLLLVRRLPGCDGGGVDVSLKDPVRFGVLFPPPAQGN